MYLPKIVTPTLALAFCLYSAEGYSIAGCGFAFSFSHPDSDAAAVVAKHQNTKKVTLVLNASVSSVLSSLADREADSLGYITTWSPDGIRIIVKYVEGSRFLLFTKHDLVMAVIKMDANLEHFFAEWLGPEGIAIAPVGTSVTVRHGDVALVAKRLEKKATFSIEPL